MSSPVNLRHVAPAGAPIHLTDLVRWAAAALTPGDASAALTQAVCDRLSVPHAFPVSTGRAGMTLLLRAMRRLAPASRSEVVLPAYTCYSVAASAIKAGLTPRIVDIAPDTLDYERSELEAVDFSRVLGIVATNLYGLPNDLAYLTTLARSSGVFLIDDAAQAMGAAFNGRASGSWGDAGLISFDKGKNVSAIDGGVVVTSSGDLAAAIEREVRALPAQGIREAGMLTAKALAYFVFLRPWLYWIPQRVPQLGLGQTVFSTEFPVARPTRPQVTLAVTMLRRLDAFTRVRIARATELLDGVRALRAAAPIEPIPGSSPAYLRLPLLAASEETRRILLQRLNAAGIGATGSYPRSLAEIPEIGPAPGARRVVAGIDVARRILTLPTHPFVGSGDVARTLAVMAGTRSPGALGEVPAT